MAVHIYTISKGMDGRHHRYDKSLRIFRKKLAYNVNLTNNKVRKEHENEHIFIVVLFCKINNFEYIHVYIFDYAFEVLLIQVDNKSE